MVRVVRAVTVEQIQRVQELFTEYFDFLRTDVDTGVSDLNDVPQLAGYEEEVATLPGRYAPPNGCLLLAEHEGQAAGCVAFYKFEDGVCEIKRLWVRPQFRGKKISRLLVERLIEEAREVGYTAIVLSTVDILKEARALYESLGFKTTAPYFDLPEVMLAHEIFMRLDLAS